MLLQNQILYAKIDQENKRKRGEKMKKEYLGAEIEIIKLAAADIITSSNQNDDEDNWSNYH